MEASNHAVDRGLFNRLTVMSTLVIGAGVLAGPRPVGEVTPTDVERAKFIGFSRIDEVPPLPPDARGNTLVQPLGLNVPIFEVVSDEMTARGAVANTGSATAIVYRNSHDTGCTLYNSADVGSFTGNLLHLGNGFPVDGGEIKGYDLLIYNDRISVGGDAACTVSLWDGDPLGLIDTRIGYPPQPIPGTTCTFSGLVPAEMPSKCIDSDGDGLPDVCAGDFNEEIPCETDADCGFCPEMQGDDIPECPGLYRLVCEFDPKVMIPSRNVWMIVEWTEGCRMGWRWAFLEGPDIGAVGEENFCDNTCPSSPVPCVDMAIEMVDAPSQWDSVGVGTCCEDPSIACDHSDGEFECAHGTSCSDGVAETFDAWCFGAPEYFASFVASVYANTETTVSLVPIRASGEHTIVDNEIIMPDGGQMINLEGFAGGWDPDGDGMPRVKVWFMTVDSSTYQSGVAGELTNSRPPCELDSDCPDNAEGEACYQPYGYETKFCTGLWMDCPGRADLCPALPSCDITSPNPRCGISDFSGPVSPPALDPGYPLYAMSVRLEASIDARGTFEVDFVVDPGTFLKDTQSAGIPLVAYVPARITIEVGKCCDRGGGPGNEHCLDNVTVGECDALGGLFFPGETCDPDVDDSVECGPFCGDNEVNQPSEECDGADDAACVGPCSPYCFCVPVCGDDEVNQAIEWCDGTDDSVCPGKCRPDCTCAAICGDGMVNHESEDCDGTDDNRCPGQCREDCTCPSGAIPAVSEWGLVVLMLLLLTGAKMYHGRRRSFT